MEAVAALETRREGREGHDAVEEDDNEEKECDRVAVRAEGAECVLEAERMRADSAWRWEVAVAADIEGMRAEGESVCVCVWSESERERE